MIFFLHFCFVGFFVTFFCVFVVYLIEITALNTNHWRYRDNVFPLLLLFLTSWTQNHVTLETFAALLWNSKFWATVDIVLAEGVWPIDSSVINWSRCGASYRILLVCIKEFDDIRNIQSDSTIQSWDTYTSTKYLPLMFASVRWQPRLHVQHNHKLIHNHVSWNISDF